MKQSFSFVSSALSSVVSSMASFSFFSVIVLFLFAVPVLSVPPLIDSFDSTGGSSLQYAQAVPVGAPSFLDSQAYIVLLFVAVIVLVLVFLALVAKLFRK